MQDRIIIFILYMSLETQMYSVICSGADLHADLHLQPHFSALYPEGSNIPGFALRRFILQLPLNKLPQTNLFLQGNKYRVRYPRVTTEFHLRVKLSYVGFNERTAAGASCAYLHTSGFYHFWQIRDLALFCQV